jgi:hypothetical protein
LRIPLPFIFDKGIMYCMTVRNLLRIQKTGTKPKHE